MAKGERERGERLSRWREQYRRQSLKSEEEQQTRLARHREYERRAVRIAGKHRCNLTYNPTKKGTSKSTENTVLLEYFIKHC